MLDREPLPLVRGERHYRPLAAEPAIPRTSTARSEREAIRGKSAICLRAVPAAARPCFRSCSGFGEALAADDDDILACDPGCIGGGEKQNDLCDVFGRAEATKRYIGARLLIQAGVGLRNPLPDASPVTRSSPGPRN